MVKVEINLQVIYLLFMPRKNLIRTHEFFYHITTRSNNQQWFQLPMCQVWDIAVDAFRVAQKNHPAVVSQFVLMSNHYHLLIRTPNEDIDRFMYFFNKTFSDKLRKESKSENRMFGSNYKWSLITHQKYFERVFIYIYQNPIRAKITQNCEDYPWSTYHYTFYKKYLPFNFTPLTHLECLHNEINHLYSLEKQMVIKKGLRKSIFKEVVGRGE